MKSLVSSFLLGSAITGGAILGVDAAASSVRFAAEFEARSLTKEQHAALDALVIGIAPGAVGWEYVTCVNRAGTIDGKPARVPECAGMAVGAADEVPPGARRVE